MGLPGFNSHGEDANVLLYSATSNVVMIDPATFQATAGATIDFGGIVRSVCGVAVLATGNLLAVNNRGLGLSPDDPYSINATIGVGTLIEDTLLAGLQALILSLGGTPYAWDRGTSILNVGTGPMTLDPLTSVFADVGPNNGLTNIQSITYGDNRTLYGGSQDGKLYQIDTTTGFAAWISSGPNNDLRELVPHIPNMSSFWLFGSGLIVLTWCRRRTHKAGQAQIDTHHSL